MATKKFKLEGACLKGADLYQIVGIGSIGRCTTYDAKNDKIICGCFYGSLAEFEERIETVYNVSQHGTAYKAGIAFFKAVKETYHPKKNTCKLAQFVENA